MSATILYLNFDAESDPDPDICIPRMTLAGMRRYAAARGWNVEVCTPEQSRAEVLPALLASHAPVVGCVYECAGDNPPGSLAPFGNVPVVFHQAAHSFCAARVTCVRTDNEAVAQAAFRELAANRPSAFAVVGSRAAFAWSVARERTFAALAKATGFPCAVLPQPKGETQAARAKRLSAFVAALPRCTAVFAVNDYVAAEVLVAARATHRAIPRELTLLGVDNHLAVCEASHPTISSIQIDFERAGYIAASMLAATMKGRSRAALGIRGLASLEMKGRAEHGIKGAACAANGDNTSFGGSSATLHCAEGAVIGPLLVVRRESTRGWGRREPFVMEAVGIIRSEACDGITVAELARRVRVPVRHFALRFREAMGHSALDEILYVRMERVFTLLRDTETPISAIAALCGWRSDIALRWLFRRRTGMSMRQWRRENA